MPHDGPLGPPPSWAAEVLTKAQLDSLPALRVWLLLVRQSDLPGPAKGTAGALATYVGSDGKGEAFPSLETLAMDTGYSKATLYRATAELVRRRFILARRPSRRDVVRYAVAWPVHVLPAEGVSFTFRPVRTSHTATSETSHSETSRPETSHSENGTSHRETETSHSETQKGFRRGSRRENRAPLDQRERKRESIEALLRRAEQAQTDDGRRRLEREAEESITTYEALYGVTYEATG